MGTDTKKNETIKIRVSKEQKDLFKYVATQKNMTLTELLIVGTEELINKENLKSKEIEIVTPRVERLEREFEIIKARMEDRKQATKKFKWHW
ncbi:type II toxin-antitoxin system TacA family antitoxin [Clostridium culturomicium]|uniref:hypothetical protein n=1 Tax=Clostridium culturomicium TaxID=1499683 RepID=UPI00058D2E00|nr:hypothetical protein [Clostridium culturomicium]